MVKNRFEFSWKVWVTRSNQNKLLKEIGLYQYLDENLQEWPEFEAKLF
jgi:hypothetical protein